MDCVIFTVIKEVEHAKYLSLRDKRTPITMTNLREVILNDNHR